MKPTSGLRETVLSGFEVFDPYIDQRARKRHCRYLTRVSESLERSPVRGKLLSQTDNQSYRFVTVNDPQGIVC
jgi:hypothetical protein